MRDGGVSVSEVLVWIGHCIEQRRDWPREAAQRRGSRRQHIVQLRFKTNVDGQGDAQHAIIEAIRAFRIAGIGRVGMAEDHVAVNHPSGGAVLN